jgi:hypothetical protein
MDHMPPYVPNKNVVSTKKQLLIITNPIVIKKDMWKKELNHYGAKIPIFIHQGNIDWDHLQSNIKNNRDSFFSFEIKKGSNGYYLKGILNPSGVGDRYFPTKYVIELKDKNYDRMIRAEIILADNYSLIYKESNIKNKCPNLHKIHLGEIRESCNLPLLIR